MIEGTHLLFNLLSYGISLAIICEMKEPKTKLVSANWHLKAPRTDKPESLCVASCTPSRLNLKSVLRKSDILWGNWSACPYRRSRVGGGGICMSLVWISKHFFFLHTEEEAMSLWLFYYYAFLHFCHISVKALKVISVKFLLTASNITALQNTVVMRTWGHDHTRWI